MAYSFRKTDPTKAGVLRREKVRCGKKNCHCATGERHEAHYIYYRDYPNGGKLRKKYVPKNKLCFHVMRIGLSKLVDRYKKMSFYDRLEAWERLNHETEYYFGKYLPNWNTSS